MNRPPADRAAETSRGFRPATADDPSCCPPAACCGPLSRRTFLKWTGLSVAGIPAARTAIAGPFQADDVRDHFVPADKRLHDEWIQALFAKGGPTWYEAADLETIGMPVGGIAAGQVYLAGDGRLVHWDVFNQHIFTGYGRDNYALDRRPEPGLAQGFALRVATGGQQLQRTLDIDGFPGLRFCGEYPIGTVEYRDADFPVSVRLEAFSPFIPLNEEDSALPATVLQFTLANTGTAEAEVTLAGWLENGVCRHSSQGLYGLRRNAARREKGAAMVLATAEATEPPEPQRPPIVLADFEGDHYGDWQVEGQAFGDKPARGTLPQQQNVSGFAGKGLVNTYLGGNDRLQGKLTSPEFTIERNYLSFLIGGGNHPDRTAVRLLVDGQVVRSATGKNNERLEWCNWDVRPWAGRQARLEIVDQQSGPWGHINVDQIELRDQPMPAIRGRLADQPDFGSMCLAVLGDDPQSLLAAGLGEQPPAEAVFSGLEADPQPAERPFGSQLSGAAARKLSLAPGEEATVTFVVAWCFPRREVRGGRRDNYYANRFRSAAEVAGYVAENAPRLIEQTRLWHATWYASSLPHWLLDRLFSTASTLATSTCQWWSDGRFWAWEGVGCCHGTCTHVWNYEHTMARLFPRLERSVRELQDYHPQAGYVEDTGMIRFRGEDWGMWAGDGQAGTILKAFREHQVSGDGRFLGQYWPRIKKSLEFLIREDADENGLLEGSQHNTYDIDFVGPNTMVGSLYLAALRAGEEMAVQQGDREFAARCRRLFDSGSRLTAQRLFNGEYYIQEVDLQKHPQHQYADGCLSDQLFGQGWAHQVGLGHIYPREQVVAALQAIWKYNWIPDVGPHNEAHPPERWFARPGEAGLFTCTWPHSKHLDRGVRYMDEVWTGIEYQVAGHMAWEGLLTEALAICRGVHERYHPSKHNPWNEVECGDHYARGMASHGVFLALGGFEYDGPAGRLGFAPRIDPEDFRAAFTAAEGWGTIAQQRSPGGQTQQIKVRWGQLRVQELSFELPDDARAAAVAVSRGGAPVAAELRQEGRRVTIRLDQPLTVEKDQTLQIELRTA